MVTIISCSLFQYDMAKEGDSNALQTLGSTILEETSSQLMPEDLLYLSEQIVQMIDLVDDVTDPQVISVS